MPTLEYPGVRVEVDEEGYLVRFEDWNEEVACALAEREGILEQCPLNRERMDVLLFLRDYYRKFDSFPMVRAVCRNVRQPDSCEYEQFMDPIRAWKIAGLPKPTTEVFAYIQHKM
jgi:TusE/DsrC/DsvC family sulfur relay protein